MPGCFLRNKLFKIQPQLWLINKNQVWMRLFEQINQIMVVFKINRQTQNSKFHKHQTPINTLKLLQIDIMISFSIEYNILKMQNSEDAFISVRVHRDKSTHFFICGQYDLVDMLKRKIILFHKGVDVNEVRLFYDGKLLDDKSNIHDQGVVSNSLIQYKLKKGLNGQWEDIPEVVF